MSRHAIETRGSANTLRKLAHLLPPLAVTSVLLLYPLACIVHDALTAPLALNTLESNLFWNSLVTTLWIALCASVGCVTLGLMLAVVLSYATVPGRDLIVRLINAFIALPSFLVALAFAFLYGSAGLLNALLETLAANAPPRVDFLHSVYGVILAEITVYTPFALRPLLASFARISPTQLELAASLGGRAMLILQRIILPASRQALLSAGLLCLLLTINELGIVLFMGAKGVVTLPLLIYTQAIQESNYAGACWLALADLVLSLSVYGLYRIALKWWGSAHAMVV